MAADVDELRRIASLTTSHQQGLGLDLDDKGWNGH